MECFARSGGTLLNKCLASLPDVVMISEVNPLGGGGGKGDSDSWLQTVKDQAKGWYGIELKSDEYADSIEELNNICVQKNKKLIVRDWPYVNFVPDKQNGFKPPNKLLAYEALRDRLDVIPFCFSRNSIDVWLSRGTPEINDFFQQYYEYVKQIDFYGMQKFKYEDFVDNPDEQMQKICKYTGLEYSTLYKKYNTWDKVNGDVQLKAGSRGIRAGEIKSFKRRFIPVKQVLKLNSNVGMVKSNKAMDYNGKLKYELYKSVKMKYNRLKKFLKK